MGFCRRKVLVIVFLLLQLPEKMTNPVNLTKFNIVIKPLFFMDKQGRMAIATGPLPSYAEKTVHDHLGSHIDLQNVDQIRFEPVFQTSAKIPSSKSDALELLKKDYPAYLVATMNESFSHQLKNDTRRSNNEDWFYNVISLNYAPPKLRNGTRPTSNYGQVPQKHDYVKHRSKYSGPRHHFPSIHRQNDEKAHAFEEHYQHKPKKRPKQDKVKHSPQFSDQDDDKANNLPTNSNLVLKKQQYTEDQEPQKSPKYDEVHQSSQNTDDVNNSPILEHLSSHQHQDDVESHDQEHYQKQHKKPPTYYENHQSPQNSDDVNNSPIIEHLSSNQHQDNEESQDQEPYQEQHKKPSTYYEAHQPPQISELIDDINQPPTLTINNKFEYQTLPPPATTELVNPPKNLTEHGYELTPDYNIYKTSQHSKPDRHPPSFQKEGESLSYHQIPVGQSPENIVSDELLPTPLHDIHTNSPPLSNDEHVEPPPYHQIPVGQPVSDEHSSMPQHDQHNNPTSSQMNQVSPRAYNKYYYQSSSRQAYGFQSPPRAYVEPPPYHQIPVGQIISYGHSPMHLHKHHKNPPHAHKKYDYYSTPRQVHGYQSPQHENFEPPPYHQIPVGETVSDEHSPMPLDNYRKNPPPQQMDRVSPRAHNDYDYNSTPRQVHGYQSPQHEHVEPPPYHQIPVGETVSDEHSPMPLHDNRKNPAPQQMVRVLPRAQNEYGNHSTPRQADDHQSPQHENVEPPPYHQIPVGETVSAEHSPMPLHEYHKNPPPQQMDQILPRAQNEDDYHSTPRQAHGYQSPQHEHVEPSPNDQLPVDDTVSDEHSPMPLHDYRKNPPPQQMDRVLPSAQNEYDNLSTPRQANGYQSPQHENVEPPPYHQIPVGESISDEHSPVPLHDYRKNPPPQQMDQVLPRAQNEDDYHSTPRQAHGYQSPEHEHVEPSPYHQLPVDDTVSDEHSPMPLHDYRKNPPPQQMDQVLPRAQNENDNHSTPRQAHGHQSPQHEHVEPPPYHQIPVGETDSDEHSPVPLHDYRKNPPPQQMDRVSLRTHYHSSLRQAHGYQSPQHERVEPPPYHQTPVGQIISDEQSQMPLSKHDNNPPSLQVSQRAHYEYDYESIPRMVYGYKPPPHNVIVNEPRTNEEYVEPPPYHQIPVGQMIPEQIDPDDSNPTYAVTEPNSEYQESKDSKESVSSEKDESDESESTITTDKPIFVPNDIYYAIEKKCANWSDQCNSKSPAQLFAMFDQLKLYKNG